MAIPNTALHSRKTRLGVWMSAEKATAMSGVAYSAGSDSSAATSAICSPCCACGREAEKRARKCGNAHAPAERSGMAPKAMGSAWEGKAARSEK
eukprot:scaffold9761_cov118-Isochrysis_galbana.AAC.6